MQSEGSHQDNLLNLAPAGGGLHSRQLGLESLTHRGTSEGMDKYDENLTLEKYSQVTSGRIVKYNGDTSGSGMDKYSMGIEKYGRETSMGASGLDKYRERFRQDRCRYANELVRQTSTLKLQTFFNFPTHSFDVASLLSVNTNTKLGKVMHTFWGLL